MHMLSMENDKRIEKSIGPLVLILQWNFVFCSLQICNICHEPFEQYWDEELEEWHLRDAIKVNNKTYHPICYEDYTEVCSHLLSFVKIAKSQLYYLPSDIASVAVLFCNCCLYFNYGHTIRLL